VEYLDSWFLVFFISTVALGFTAFVIYKRIVENRKPAEEEIEKN
jgi:hypothetical protein